MREGVAGELNGSLSRVSEGVAVHLTDRHEDLGDDGDDVLGEEEQNAEHEGEGDDEAEAHDLSVGEVLLQERVGHEGADDDVYEEQTMSVTARTRSVEKGEKRTKSDSETHVDVVVEERRASVGAANDLLLRAFSLLVDNLGLVVAALRGGLATDGERTRRRDHRGSAGVDARSLVPDVFDEDILPCSDS